MKSSIKKALESVDEDDLNEKSIYMFIANIIESSKKKRVEIFNSFNNKSDKKWKNENIISDLKSGRMKLPLDAIVIFFEACGLTTIEVRRASCIVLKAYLPDDLSSFIKTPFLNDNNEIIRRFSHDLHSKQENVEHEFKSFEEDYSKRLDTERKNEIDRLKKAFDDEDESHKRIEDDYTEQWVERHSQFLLCKNKQQLNTLEILSEHPEEADILLIPFDNFSDTDRNSKINLLRDSSTNLDALSVFHRLISTASTPYYTVPSYVMLLRLVALFCKENKISLYTYSNMLIGAISAANDTKGLGNIERQFLEKDMHFISDEQRSSFIDFCLIKINRARSLGSSLFTAIDSEKKIIKVLRELNRDFHRYNQTRPKYKFDYMQSVSKSYPILKDKKARLFSVKLYFIFTIVRKVPDFCEYYQNSIVASFFNEEIHEQINLRYEEMIEKIEVGFKQLFWNSEISCIESITDKLLNHA